MGSAAGAAALQLSCCRQEKQNLLFENRNFKRINEKDVLLQTESRF